MEENDGRVEFATRSEMSFGLAEETQLTGLHR